MVGAIVVRRWLGALGVGLALSLGSSAKASDPPLAVSGPVAVTAESGEPFRGTNAQPVAGPGLPLPILQPHDFIEQEFFVSGVIDGRPYRTAMLVRRPRDPAKFSGLVAVETVHLAGAIPFWGSARVWLEGNHGWVGVASQKGALDKHLKRTNPGRYAALDIPDLAEPDDSWMRASKQDRFSQKIMTQVGALLKSNSQGGPFGDTQVKYLLMGGSSQTGGTTLRYIEESHDAARMADGSPIFDGYAPWEAFPKEPVSAKGSQIVHLVTEGDVMSYRMRSRPMATGEDRDGRDGGYRHYQVTGASHVGTRGPAADALRAYGTLDNLEAGQEVSSFPQAEVLTPANKFLVDWVMQGKAPPPGQHLDVKDGKIARDANGLAKGGVRSAWVDLPRTRYVASLPPKGTLYGLEEPFSQEKLDQLYGSCNAWLAKFDARIDAMLASGWLFADDAAKLKEEEAESCP
ncbi:MAG: alpha/beta hydrolase domain-containing protein [Novosphingobium sp.]|nr:alpha/beta hydrolase domain-containing protein [Novosphingobium sp.]